MPRNNPNAMTPEQRDKFRRQRVPGSISATIRGKDNTFLLFFYTDRRNGKPCAIGFRGKALKASLHCSYRDTARRWVCCKEWNEAIEADRARKIAARAARNQGHTLVVGDVLRATWGYDQTNVDYYEVIALKGKTMVTVRKIGAQSASDHWMQGESVPARGKFIGEAMHCRVNAQHKSIRVSNCANASYMAPVAYVGGQPTYAPSRWTSYA